MHGKIDQPTEDMITLTRKFRQWRYLNKDNELTKAHDLAVKNPNKIEAQKEKTRLCMNYAANHARMTKKLVVSNMKAEHQDVGAKTLSYVDMCTLGNLDPESESTFKSLERWCGMCSIEMLKINKKRRQAMKDMKALEGAFYEYVVPFRTTGREQRKVRNNEFEESGKVDSRNVSAAEMRKEAAA